MIYRIQPKINTYLQLHVPGRATRAALGKNSDFDIDHRPIVYSDHWKPFEIEFCDLENSASVVPDLSLRIGKLYCSERAYDALKEILSPHGEFLPVLHFTGKGYIYNCLEVAEKLDAINEKLSMHKPLEGCFSIVFNEDRLKNINAFKCEVDFNGLFCQSSVKAIVESENLTGIEFVEDVGHPFPPDADMVDRH